MKKQIALFALALASGCATTPVMLQPPGGNAVVMGKIIRGMIEPHRIEIVLDGKRYRGEWRGGPPPDAVSWPHRRHVGTAHAELMAQDGSRMSCTWTYHGVDGKGYCLLPDGREYAMTTQ